MDNQDNEVISISCLQYIHLAIKQEQWSPLHVASENGFVDIVELLIDCGTNPNIQNKVGTS